MTMTRKQAAKENATLTNKQMLHERERERGRGRGREREREREGLIAELNHYYWCFNSFPRREHKLELNHVNSLGKTRDRK